MTKLNNKQYVKSDKSLKCKMKEGIYAQFPMYIPKFIDVIAS